jgi:hypothetical protein
MMPGDKSSDATADDMLQIFAYIIVKTKVDRLWQHIQFVRIFDVRSDLTDEEAFSFQNLQIALELVLTTDIDEWTAP